MPGDCEREGMPGHPAGEAVTEGSRLYETSDAVSQYLEFHYGPSALGVPNFPEACADAAISLAEGVPRDRCLDLGTAVGRAD